MEKLLTVSIAAYNVDEYLDEILNSFIKSTVLSEIEILIINDGSTDRTKEIAEKYQASYPDSIILLDKENGGWGSTVNTGISNASGKYFKLLDGDDKFQNIDDYIGILKTVDADLIYTQYLKYYIDTKEESVVGFKNEVSVNKILPIKSEYFVDFIAMHACTFKTELLKNKVFITEHCFYTDVEYVLKSILNVKNVYFSPIVVYWYRLGRVGQSASIEGQREHYKEHLKVLCKLLKIYKSMDEKLEYKKIYKNRLKMMVDQQYGMFLILNHNAENARLLKKFDIMIKNNFPEFYYTDRKRIRIFRKFGSVIYPFIVYK